MKELTIEEKAQRYDKAIERAKEFYILCKKCGAKDTIDFLEDSFSELKESEDEKIMKAIKYGLDHVFTNNTTVFEVTKEQCLAWLEKQGEQKPADKYNIRGIKSKHAEGKLGEMIKEMKSADKVEPKFKIGDTIKDPYGDTYHIIEIENDSYKSDDGRFILFTNEKFYTLFNPAWSEEDEEMLNLIIARLHSHPNVDLEEYSKEYDWLNYNLKSLRPQEQWKPSEELITYLYEAIDIIEEQEKYSIVTALRELLEQLKQL